MLSGPFSIPEKTQRAMFLFHGYGASGDDLMGIVPTLSKIFKNMAFFAPNAPKQTLFSGYEWFSLDDFTSPNAVSLTYLDQLVKRAQTSCELARSYIEHIQKSYQLSSKDIILAGFSQGGLIAQYTALTHSEPFQAVLSLSSVPLVFDKALPAEHIKQHLPILLTHGANDTVIPPLALQLSTRELAKAKQYPAPHLIPDLDHGINDVCLEQIIHFLKTIS